jgi:hypothetical protein
MRTVTSPPASPRRPLGAGLTEAKARRRWPRALLWLVVVAVVVYIAAFAAFVSRYQPLTADTLGASIDRDQVVGSVDATSPGGSSFTQYRVAAVHGRRFSYAFTLVNDGRLPVTITSVGTQRGDLAPLSQTGVRIGETSGANRFLASRATTFEPFTLSARGGSRLVVIDARMSDCQPGAGGSSAYGTVDVTYKVVGLVTKHATLALPYTIQVPDDAACAVSPKAAGQNS